MKQIFISDLHLHEQLDFLTDGFLRFLSEIDNTTNELYILGDFFEIWLGDDHDTPFNEKIIKALRQFSGDIFIMHGNRDFLIGSTFCYASGTTLLPDSTVISTPAGDSLLLHGDSLCTRDINYMKAREVFRSKSFQTDFLSKSITERSEIAEQIRGKSKTHIRESAADIMDVTPSEVIKSLSKAQSSIMIHGHTHRPAVHKLSIDDQAATRYVLGDWGQTMKYLVIEDNEPQLMTYAVGIPE